MALVTVNHHISADQSAPTPEYICIGSDNPVSLDSEDDFRLGCRNVSHKQQQFFCGRENGPDSPGGSHHINADLMFKMGWVLVNMKPTTTSQYGLDSPGGSHYINADLMFKMGWVPVNMKATTISQYLS